MKVETDAILVCSSCGVEGEHELLYLSDHLRTSCCSNCGASRHFSSHVYAEYVRDLAERTAGLPRKLAGEVFKSPTWVVTWPAKAVRKPFSVLWEIGQVTAIEHRDRLPKILRRKNAAC